MQGSSGDRPSSSTRPNKPPASDSGELGRWRPSASVMTAARQSHFAALNAEEKRIYRNWRRATLVFYAVFLCGVAAIAIAVGPADSFSTAKNGDIYSTLASAVQRNSH